MKTVLVAGEINVDLIFGGCTAIPRPDAEALAETFSQVPGSSSMICAIGLARLGQPVIFTGWAGDDAYGAFCIAAMRAAGIDVGAVWQTPESVTGVTAVLSNRADRALITFPGGIDALQASDVDDGLLGRAQHLHVSSFYLQRRLRPGLADLFARVRRAGLTVSLDPGFDPEQRWTAGDEWARLLKTVDVFLPNRGELLAITGEETVDAALRALANGTTRIVVKCGADGAVSRDDTGALLHVAAYPPDTVCDSTGAGDSFDAGFLYAWLAGMPVGDCLRWGNACGSLSTRGLGGTATQPRADEARSWVEAHP